MFTGKLKIVALVSLISVVSLTAFLAWYGGYQNLSGTNTEPKIAKNTELASNYGKIPLHFEQNGGQVDEQAKFLARGNGYSLFLTSDEVVLALNKAKTEGQNPESDVLRMKIGGANRLPAITPENQLEGKTNYFTGNDSSQWKTGIANYERVRYPQIYDGVDLVFHGNQERLEYDFIVEPNAEPNKIELNFDGADDLEIADNGDLVFKFGIEELRQHKPIAYQEINGTRREIAANYVIKNQKSKIKNQKVAFELGDYDHSQSLIIDPVLSYSTYLGGGADTFGTSIAVDSSGSAYITGSTDALDFPLVNSFQSSNTGGTAAFVTKLNAAGTAFVYSTYLGGNSRTFSSSIKVDAQGSSYVAGLTLSSNFPTTPGAYRTSPRVNSFITKLSPNGASLSYSTYLAVVDQLTAIALDSSGNAYTTGYTRDLSFPTTPGAYKPTLVDGTQNAFVTKLNAAGSALVYSTFVGINTPIPGTDAQDKANAIAIDSPGNAYITGQTTSQNYPVTTGAFQTSPASRLDAFITKLNPSGTALVYSTYLGGINDEIGTGIAVDATGNAYVTGNFEGTPNFPFTLNGFRNGAGERCCGQFNNSFLTKINPTGTALIYSTALGIGRSGMSSGGVAVDRIGSAYVIGGEGLGAAYSINAVQPISHSNDAYILKMNPAGTALAYSTPFGGNGISNQGSVGTAIALDTAGNAYFTGYTTASDFPITPGAPQSTKPGGQSYTAFVAKIGIQTNDCPAIEINPQPLPTAIFRQSYNQQLTATGGTAPYTFSLAPNFANNILPTGLTLAPDGTLSGTPTDVNLGTYLVTVQAVAANGCIGIRTLQLVLLGGLQNSGSPDLYIRVVSRPIIRIGNEYTFFVLYKNRTNTDLTNVPLAVTVPDFVSIHPKFDQPVQTVQQDGNTFIVFNLPRIPATNGTDELLSLPITVKVVDPNQAHHLFDLIAYTFTPIPGNPRRVPPPPPPYGPPGGTDPRTPNDPNDKSGPGEIGTAHYYTGDVALPYVVTFENIDTASLPAQDVVVTDQLDPNVFDLTTFRFNAISFGDKLVTPVTGVNQFTTDVDLRPAKNAIVRVNGNFNGTTGLITWRFNTLDPVTFLPPDDPLAGFLPPNHTSPEGQGTILFTVKARQGLATGTQIRNMASIVFDVNAAINTPEWLNTIDNTKPTSSVQPLPPMSPKSFPVSWAGTDVGSGIASYTVFVSDNGAPFTPFIVNTRLPNGIFTGQTGHTYGFYSIARDAVGNEEPTKTTAEVTTTDNGRVSVSGRVFTSDGRGLRNATVSITDSNGNRRNVTTSSFGFYQFDNVLSDQTYMFNVSSRLFRFAPLVLQVTDTLSTLDFTGQE